MRLKIRESMLETIGEYFYNESKQATNGFKSKSKSDREIRERKS